MDATTPDNVCTACINNRLSARIRRFLSVLAPAPLAKSLVTPLDHCLKKAS
jgi:hypothetical protein